jgi:hypothetical protein
MTTEQARATVREANRMAAEERQKDAERHAANQRAVEEMTRTSQELGPVRKTPSGRSAPLRSVPASRPSPAPAAATPAAAATQSAAKPKSFNSLGASSIYEARAAARCTAHAHRDRVETQAPRAKTFNDLARSTYSQPSDEARFIAIASSNRGGR